MSVFSSALWDSSVWAKPDGSSEAVSPITDLFARLNGTGTAVDPMSQQRVFADIAGDTQAGLSGQVARIDTIAGVSASFTNGTATQQPILRTGGLEFDGVNDRLSAPDIPELRFGTTDFTLAFACTPDVVTGSHGIWSKRGTGGEGTNPGWGLRQVNSNLHLEYDHPLNTVLPPYSIASGVFAVGVPQYGLVRIDRTAGTATARIGGVDFAPAALVIGDITSTNSLVIGSQPVDVHRFDGTIGRLLAIDKLLGPEDTAIVEDWLQNLI